MLVMVWLVWLAWLVWLVWLVWLIWLVWLGIGDRDRGSWIVDVESGGVGSVWVESGTDRAATAFNCQTCFA